MYICGNYTHTHIYFVLLMSLPTPRPPRAWKRIFWWLILLALDLLGLLLFGLPAVRYNPLPPVLKMGPAGEG